MQRALNQIEMQGHSDDENVDIPVQQDIHLEMAQQNPDPEEIAQQADNLMNISAAAYCGGPNDSTISLLLHFPHASAIALADTGSTNTFMDYHFALKNKIPMEKKNQRTVKVAGGGLLSSDAIAYNCTFSIQGHKFTTNFRILELQGSDIILGVNWFRQHNPVTFDFLGRSLTLGVNGSLHTFQDHLLPKDKLIISSDKCSKLIEQGALGYMLFSTSDTSNLDEHPPIPEEMSDLLHQFQDIFQAPTGLPPHRDCDHHIPLKEGAKPYNVRPYRMSHSQKNSVELLVKEMLKNSEIRISTSPYSSPVILVRKNDKSWRLCVDFRGLNDMIVKNKFPIPVIEDLLDELQGATIFTKFDLRSGYHQIRMRPEDIPKTAFSTHLGHYEYVVMPFGLCNAPATFPQLMNTIFSKYLRKFVLVFFDDMLVYSQNLADHLIHLEQVMSEFQQHGLKAKLSKCSFGQPQVQYLGHIISGSGVQTDPSKIQDIVKWKTPHTLKKLRGFLGLTGYYRRFIPHYALICQPLYNALKKNAFQWGPEQ
jgi:hypothetical protein